MPIWMHASKFLHQKALFFCSSLISWSYHDNLNIKLIVVWSLDGGLSLWRWMNSWSSIVVDDDYEQEKNNEIFKKKSFF